MTMRGAIFFFVVSMMAVVILLGCSSQIESPFDRPPPVKSMAQQLLQPDKPGDLIKVCDGQGICCYSRYTNRWELSCVATRVEVVVSPGDLNDEQREPKTRGEVGSRALESRVFQDPRRTGYLPYGPFFGPPPTR